MPTIKQTFFIVFFGCLGLILTALYMQYQMDMKPCALCITQRVFVILVGIFALLAALHNPGLSGRRIYCGLGGLTAIIGGLFSARHLWLQSLPADEVPACGPSLDYLMDVFPLTDVLSIVLSGDGSCAEVAWSLFGISIPGWTLLGFIGLLAVGAWQILQPKI